MLFLGPPLVLSLYPQSTFRERHSQSGCVATFRADGGDVKESRNDNPTGALHMASDRTRPHTLRGPVVSSLFSVAARR
jgi:hypothetical protein